MDMNKSTFTITFGDCAENHRGMQMLGERAEAGAGFTPEELRAIAARFPTAEYVDLGENAAVLVLRDGMRLLGVDPTALYQEQVALDHDRKVFMYGQVRNKHARWNLCFDEASQEPEYETGKGRVYAFSEVPLLSALRAALAPAFGPKADGLKAEGNYYFDVTKCGIGYHGDTERRKVIAVRMGASLPIHYQWYHRSKPVGEHFVIPLHHGDLYIMSEKAVGCDWKRSSILTLRHATGCAKFTDVKN